MNKFPICLTLIVLFSLTLVSAQNSDRPEGFPGPSSDQSGGQIPPSIIEELTQPLQNAFQPLVDAAKYILGGIFGLYVLLVLIRIYYERKKIKLLKDIRFDLDHLNRHFDVSHSAHRKSFFGHLWSKIRGRL